MRVRRNVSALAALILVGASVAAGVSPAAADGNWTFDGVEPLYTSASFTLTGQSDPGYVDVVPSEGTGCENVYSSPTWTCVITVEDSVQNLSIELRDHTTGTLHETAATSVVIPPTISGTDNDEEITKVRSWTPRATVRGRATPSVGEVANEVRVTLDLEGDPASTTCDVDSDGFYACDFSTELEPGVYRIHAEQRPEWAGEQWSDEADETYLDIAASGIVIDDPDDDEVLDTVRPTFRGTSSNATASQVDIIDASSGDVLCSSPLEGDAWECTPEEDLPGSDLSFYAQQYDNDENERATFSRYVELPEAATIEPPSINEVPEVVTQGATLTFSGTASVGDGTISVAVQDDPATEASDGYAECLEVPIDPEGFGWSCSISTGELHTGSFSVSVRHEVGDNWSERVERFFSIYVDEGGEGGEGGSGSDIDLDCTWSPGGVTFSSPDDEPYSLNFFHILDDNFSSSTAIGGGTCNGLATPLTGTYYYESYYDSNGNQSCSVDSEQDCTLENLAPGTYDFDFRAGGEGPAGEFYFTVPEAPGISTEETEGGTAFGGTGESGNAIVVLDEDGNVACEATVGSGMWTCTQTEGAEGKRFRAYQVDAASGAHSPLSSLVSSLDLYSPAISSPDNEDPLDTGRPELSGYGYPGATIDVLEDSTDIGCVETTVDAWGAWTCQLDEGYLLTPGSHQLRVQEYVEGDGYYTGPVTTFFVATAIDITSPEDGTLVTTSNLTITGTAARNANLSVRITDIWNETVASCSETRADPDGQFSCEVTDLPTSAELHVDVTDDEQNSDTAAFQSLQAPQIDYVQSGELRSNTANSTVTGQAWDDGTEPSQVVCAIDGDDIPEPADVTEGGLYECHIPPLENGSYDLTVRQSPHWAGGAFSAQQADLTLTVFVPYADPIVYTEGDLLDALDYEGLESITLGDDIVATSNAILEIPAGITLDLAGHALTTRAMQLESFTTVLDAAHGGAGDTLEVALTIEDNVGGGQLTAASGTNTYRAAIRTSGSSLLITSGTVFAYGDKGGAGIGGDPQSAGGDLFITGGTVVADSSETGAGIGGGGLPYNAGGPSGGGSAGRVWIEGSADVTATARNGAAIGAGMSGTIGEIRISGDPTVVATSSVYGAGIGGGGYSYNASGTISITGGTVTATGGASPAGAGIGTGGYSGTPGVIDITIGAGADVTAVNGSGASAVGNGTGASESGEISVAVAGTLRIPADANLDVPLGTTFFVDASGVIAGTGTISGDGHIDNDGSITVANDNVSVAVYNHNYDVTFYVNDGETDDTAHEQVFAASFADGDRDIPTSFDGETDISDLRPGYVFRGWNSESDGSGLDVDVDTDISSLAVSSFAPGAVGIPLYAQWESEASALVVTGPDGGGYTFEAVIGEPLPLSGSAAPGSTISVYVGGEEICAEASMSDGGVWSCIVPASTIDSIVGTAGITIVQRGLNDTYNEDYSIHVDPTIAVTGDDGFAAAIAAAGISTIVLTGDTNYGAGLLSLPRTMTIDLAGHTLTTASIDIFDGGSLTVRSTVDGLGEAVAPAGRLDADAGLDAAGIQTSGATLYIQSGTVDATGNGYGAGIGGDINGGANAGSVDISGGTVTAIGGSSGAGIGGGSGGAGGEVTVGDGLENGPTVTATGGAGAPGIGNGYSSTATAGSLAVDFGATVTVSGGNGASAVGAASGASGDYDELSVAGELVIDSTLRVAPAGLTTVEESGIISGTGSLDGAGTVSNWGRITVATVTADVDYNKHALVFHDNFGADATQTVTIYADSFSNANSELAPPSTTRPGWVFRGWNTQADGEGSDLCLEDVEGCEGETTFVSDSSDQTFYARWVAEELRITATVDGDAVEQHATLQAGTEIALTVTAYDPESGAELGDRTGDVVFREGNDYRTSNPFTLENAAESESLWVELRTDYSVKGEFVIAVTPGDFYQLLIDPDQTGDLPAGTAVRYTVYSFDEFGNAIDGYVPDDISLEATDDSNPDITRECGYLECEIGRAGIYTVTATSAETGVGAPAATSTLTIVPGPVDSITLSPAESSIAAGESVDFAIASEDVGGNDLGEVDDAELALAGTGLDEQPIDTSAMTCDLEECSPTVPGEYTVTAHVGEATDTAAVSVVAGGLDEIRIGQPEGDLAVGDTFFVNVSGYDVAGNVLDEIGDVAITITADGIDTTGFCDGYECSPLKPGTYEITATVEGVEPAAVTLQVVLGDLDHIALTPVESDIQAGESADLAVEQFDVGDNSLGFTDDASLTLEGTTAGGDPIDTESVSCDLSGCAPTVPGTYTVTARVGEAADSATITVTEGELHEIRITPLEGELAVGDSVTIEVTGYDVAGNVLAAIDDAEIAIAADGIDTTGFCDGHECSPLKPGSYEITATVDGIEPANVWLDVVLGAVTGVTLTLDGTTYVAGDDLDYEVDLVDAGDNEILDPQTPTNFELDGEPCSIDGGCFTTDAGSHVLVAINNGHRSAEQPFTVDHAEPTSVEFHGPDGDVSADETTFPFTATGFDEFGNEFAVDVLVDGEVPCEGLGDCNWHHRGTHVVTVDGYEGDDGRLDFSTVIGAVTVTLAPIETVVAGDEIAFDITARDHWYNEPLTESTIRVTPESNGDDDICVTLPCVIETPGTYVAVAENDGIASDPQTFEVTTGTPDSITLDVLATTVVAGTSVVASATVYDSLLNEVEAAEVTFSLDGVDCPSNECTPLHTDDPNVLLAYTTVSERGETVRIESEPQALNVIPATAKTLAISPDTDGFSVDADAATLPISATATDSFGNTFTVDVAVDGYATCAPNEECTWRTAGAHTASATVTGISGELTDTVAFETQHGAVTSVELSGASTMLAGEVQPFSVTVEDAWGNPVSTGTTFTITPDADGATSVCFSVSCTVNTLGSYVVRAENNDVVDTAELSVEVGPVASVALTVPETITAGDEPEPTVVLRDLGSNVIDEPSTGTEFELDGEPCAIDGDCWATTVASYELVALNNGVESSGAIYTVDHASAESIAFEGDENPSADDTLTYTAVGTDPYDNEFDMAAVIPDDWRLVGEHRVTVAGYEDFTTFTTRIGALTVTLSEIGDVTAGDQVPFEVSAEDAWTNVSEQPSTITLAPSVSECTITECVIEDAGSYTATAHNDGVDSEPVSFEVVAGPATEVELTVPTTTITAGDTLEYSAVARDAFGNELENAITYTLDGVPCAGVACSPTLVSARNLLVASTLGDDDEPIHSETVDLTVTPAVAKTLSITSPATDENGDVVIGADASTLPFSATATDTYGNTTDVAFTVDTVAPCAAGLDCVWRDAGPHTVSATTPGVDGQLTANQAFTTVHGDAFTVELSADDATVDAGDAQPLTVTVTDAWGNTFTDGTVITVAPKTGPPASVCSSLDCVISEPGVYELRASNGEASDTADLTVVVGPVASVELTIADPTLVAGQSLEATITLEDKVGNPVTSSSTTTTVTRDGVVCQLASTCASTVARTAPYSLVATNNGITSEAVTYSVEHAAASTLAISGPSTVSADATALPFTAEATDSYGNTFDVPVLIDGATACGGTDPCDWRTAGVTHEVTAASGSVTASETFTTTVGSITDVELNASRPFIVAGATQPFSITATDAWGNDSLAESTISIVDDESTVACNTLDCVLTTPGLYTATAYNSGTASTSVALEVTLGPVARVTLSGPSTITAGDDLSPIVTTYDSVDNVIAEGDRVTETTFELDGEPCDEGCSSTRAGAHTLVAVNNGIESNELDYTVTASATVRTEIDGPAADEVDADGIFPFSATAYDEWENETAVTVAVDGSPVCDGIDCSWRTAGVHTVSAPGAESVTFTTIPGAVSNIVFEGDAQITAGDAQPYAVTATDTWGNEVDGTTVTISRDSTTFCESLSCTLSEPGEYTLTATNGITRTATFVVIVGEVAFVTIEPTETALVAGEQLGFSVLLEDSERNEITDADIIGQTVLTLDGVECDGEADCTSTTARDEPYVVRATNNGLFDEFSYTVSVAAAGSVTLYGPAPVGGVIEIAADTDVFPFTATAIDLEDNAFEVDELLVDGEALCDDEGACAWRSAGEHTVSVDIDGEHDEASFTTVAGDASTVELTGDSTQITAGDAQPFDVTASDAYGNEITDGFTLSIDSDPACTALDCTIDVPGSYTAIAYNDGVASPERTLTVVAGAVHSVDLSVQNTSIVAGESIGTVTITATDRVGNVLTGDDLPSGATLELDGVECAIDDCSPVDTLAANELRAYADGVASAIVAISVTAAQTERIEFTGPTTVDADATAFPLTATAYDAFDNATAVPVFVDGSADAPCSGSDDCAWRSAGDHTVSADLDGISDELAFETLAGAVAVVELSEESTQITAGDTQPFSVTVEDSWGNPISAGTTFSITSSNDTQVCSITTCRIDTPGEYAVTAANDGLTDSATLSVVASNIVGQVALTIDDAELVAGDDLEFTVVTRDAVGNLITDPTTATTYLVDGIASDAGSTIAGSHTLRALNNGFSSPIRTFTVAAGPATTVTISGPAEGSIVDPDEPFPFTALGDDGYTNTFAVEATVSGDWHAATAHTVTAASGTASASRAFTTRVGAIDHVTLVGSDEIVAGGVQPFQVVGTDAWENETQNGSTISISRIDGPEVCTSRTCTITTPGSYTATGTNGGVSSPARQFTVIAGPLDHFTITPASDDVTAGDTTRYVPHGFDAYGNSVAAPDDVVLTVRNARDDVVSGAEGLDVTLVTAGTYTITASSQQDADDAATPTANLTVNADELDEFTLTPADATATAGTQPPFTVTAVDQYGNGVGSTTVTFTARSDVDANNTCASSYPCAVGTYDVLAVNGDESRSAVLHVVAAAAASVTISPASAAMLVGESRTFSVAAVDAFGNPVAGTTISGPSGVTCAALSCTASTPGTYTITATNGTATATATLTVTAVPAIVIDPGTTTGGTTIAVVSGDPTATSIAGTITGEIAEGTRMAASMTATGLGTYDWTCQGPDATGDWDCSLPPGAYPPGTYTLTVSATRGSQVVAQNSSLVVIVEPASTPAPTTTATPKPRPTVTPTSTATPTPSATPTRAPRTWNFTVGDGLGGKIKAGGEIDIYSEDVPEGTTGDVWLHSDPVFLGSTSVNADGIFRLKAKVPKEIPAGEHHIVITITVPGEEPIVSDTAITIDPADPDEESTGTPYLGTNTEDLATGDGGTAAGAGTDGGTAAGPNVVVTENERNEPDAVTALTKSVPSVLEIVASPVSIAVASGLTLAIMLLVALPTELLNSTLEAQSGRLGRRITRIEEAVNGGIERFNRRMRTPVIGALIIALITSIVFGFVDPEFGFDLASIRLVLSMGIAFFIVSYGASAITGRILGRTLNVASEISMQPFALVFAILGVVLARTLGFSPGFLVGLVVGLEIASQISRGQKLKATAVQLGVIVALAIAAWLGYSLALAIQGEAPLDFGSGLIQDALTAVVSEGLTAAFVGLLPLTYFDGKEIFDLSKKAWVALYLFVGIPFVLLVLPSAATGQSVSDLLVWTLVMLGFTLLTFIIWGIARWRESRSPAEEAELVDAE